jgi:hypothetical protein
MNNNHVARDFVSDEKREFKFRMGQTLASALTGFIAGVIASLIVFVVIYNLLVK